VSFNTTVRQMAEMSQRKKSSTELLCIQEVNMSCKSMMSSLLMAYIFFILTLHLKKLMVLYINVFLI